MNEIQVNEMKRGSALGQRAPSQAPVRARLANCNLGKAPFAAMRARTVGLVGLLALTCASAFVVNTPRTLSLAQRCSPPLAAARKKPIKKRKPIAKNKTPAEEDPTAFVGAVAGAGAVAVVADVVTDGAAISTAAVTADAAATGAL